MNGIQVFLNVLQLLKPSQNYFLQRFHIIRDLAEYLEQLCLSFKVTK